MATAPDGSYPTDGTCPADGSYPKDGDPRQSLGDGVTSDWAISSAAHEQGLTVDRDLAEAGRCGLIDLRTGFICVAERDHPGGCQRVDSHTAAAVLEHYQSQET